MSKFFKMVPCIYAGDLPQDVEDELREYNDELCFHGDSGCVFTLNREALEELPLFRQWMISVGAWTEEQVSNLVSYKMYCLERGLNCSGEPYHFKEYYDWKGNQPEYLEIAMTGT